MGNRVTQARNVGIVFLVLPWIAVTLRCWVRLKMIKAFAMDDWLAVVTLLFLTIYAGLIIGGTTVGVGRHVYELTSEQRVKAMQIWYWGEISYIITAALLRLAVGAFLLRIAVRKIHRQTVHALLTLNVVFNLFYLVFTVFQCTPIDGFWLRAAGAEGVKCRTKIAVNSTFASSAVSAFIDWSFGILPVFILWDLNVTLKKKIGLGLIMGLGVLASAGPLVRIPYTVSLEHTEDFLYDTVDVGIWSFLEPGLGLSAISLLTLRPLFVKIFQICSTKHSDAMSIGEMPSRPTNSKQQRFWQHGDAYDGRIVGQQERSCSPGSHDGRDAGPRRYGTAIRVTCEIKSVTDVGVVDVSTSRLTPPDISTSTCKSWV